MNHNEALLVWETDELANSYQLSIGTDNPPINHFVEFVGNTGDYTFADLNPNTTYFWTVTPYYGDFSAKTCNIQSFTTGDFIGINQSKHEKISITKEKGQYYLNNPNACKISELSIFNIQGISVQKKDKATNNTRIKLQINASGVHLVKFKCDNKTQVLKVSNM
ncbi:MAG: T9SS type A sorting domain-containing protein [Bacteroidales bacterium]|nr:T9SS type A sorting domain-containing protein [Bacteroidales bacterium]